MDGARGSRQFHPRGGTKRQAKKLGDKLRSSLENPLSKTLVGGKKRLTRIFVGTAESSRKP
jgi:hypothetical protein